MLQPKVLYRKLDSLLNKIGKEKTGKDFLFHIADEFEKEFGSELHISHRGIYEKVEEEFILVVAAKDSRNRLLPEKITINSPEIILLLENKIYIFDNPELKFGGIKINFEKPLIPAAITVSSPESRWIFLFELSENWEREEVDFCLNAVRTGLNYRLVSDSITNEMEQAVHIQKSLLPQFPPQINGFQIAGSSIPAELVGGDLFDYFKFNDEEFGFCIGDASGHGLPAALVARDAVTGLRMGIENQTKMVHTLKKLNKVIYQSVYSTRFISLFYAEMERNGNLFYANAGHPAPLLFHGSEITQLEATGTIFGALPEVELHRSYSFFPAGGILVLFSDGIIERKNINEKYFDVDGIIKIVSENKEKNASAIKDLIFDAAFTFGNHKKWDDDATVVVIKREY